MAGRAVAPPTQPPVHAFKRGDRVRFKHGIAADEEDSEYAGRLATICGNWCGKVLTVRIDGVTCEYTAWTRNLEPISEAT
jgi:hypothetical protein